MHTLRAHLLPKPALFQTAACLAPIGVGSSAPVGEHSAPKPVAPATNRSA